MRLVDRYSQMNGWEYLVVHRKSLWREICEVIDNVDAAACRTNATGQSPPARRKLFSFGKTVRAFGSELDARGWTNSIGALPAVTEQSATQGVDRHPSENGETMARVPEYLSSSPPRRTEFIKGRVAVDVQFRKHHSVAHDLFPKSLALFVSNVIDVGIGIVPMEEMAPELATGSPYFERELFDLMPHVRGSRAVPMVLLGVAP